MFTAVASGGVIFAYLGFEQAIQLGGESQNPRRNIPLAVIGSMVLGVVLYILLQIAFLGAPEPEQPRARLERRRVQRQRRHLRPVRRPRDRARAELAGDAALHRRVISPGGTGLSLRRHSSRISFALGAQPLHPARFERAQPARRPVPRRSRSRSCRDVSCSCRSRAGSSSSASSPRRPCSRTRMAPLALGALRREVPDHDRPFRLPGGAVLAPLAFIVAERADPVLGLGRGLEAARRDPDRVRAARRSRPRRRAPEHRPSLDWRRGVWLLPYLVGLGVVSYLGSFGGPANAFPSAGTCS